MTAALIRLGAVNGRILQFDSEAAKYLALGARLCRERLTAADKYVPPALEDIEHFLTEISNEDTTTDAAVAAANREAQLLDRQQVLADALDDVDNCHECGERITARREGQRYCSDACKQAAYRNRKRERDGCVTDSRNAAERRGTLERNAA